MESDHRGSAPPGRQGGANKAEGTAPAAGAGGCGETAGVLLAFREVGAIVSGKSVVHIKGFGGGMPDVYHSDALAQIQGFDVVVWDGDPLKAGAFTELVPLYLATNSGGLALAFKPSQSVSGFLDKWRDVIGAHPMRLRVVPVELPADAASVGVTAEAAAAACVGLPQWAAAKQVVSLGGGGIAAREAQHGTRDDRTVWTVYAVGRGDKERFASLCDFVANRTVQDGLITLVRGKDPAEEDAFSGIIDHVGAAAAAAATKDDTGGDGNDATL